AALLEGVDDGDDGVVELQEAVGAGLAQGEGLGQWLVEEGLHHLDEGVVGAGGEAGALLVGGAERDEGGLLEEVGEVGLLALAVGADEASVHADDLEGALLEVVGLLGVEG